jgi:hypothetical protein
MSPLYTMKCNQCRKVDEYLLAICESDTEVQCSKCGSLISRENNRVFLNTDAPAVHGETVVRQQKPARKKIK